LKLGAAHTLGPENGRRIDFLQVRLLTAVACVCRVSSRLLTVCDEILQNGRRIDLLRVQLLTSAIAVCAMSERAVAGWCTVCQCGCRQQQ
jgi:hypothetical protein